MVSWIALALSLIGIFLNAKKIIWCWPVWIASNILWIAYFTAQPAIDWASTILWFVFGVSNVYGWYSWKKMNDATLDDLEVEENTELEIRRPYGKDI